MGIAVVVLLGSTSCGSHSGLIPVTGVGATGNGSTLLVGINAPDVEGRSCWADVNITATAELGVVRVDVRGRKSRAPDCTPQPQLRDAAEACCSADGARRRNGSPSIRQEWKSGGLIRPG